MSTAASAPPQSVYLTLGQAARRFPSHKADGHVHPATVTRWILKGALDGHGARVLLKAKRSPAGWLTTDEWIAAFLEALTSGRTEESAPQPPTPTQRRRAAQAASKRLDALGY